MAAHAAIAPYTGDCRTANTTDTARTRVSAITPCGVDSNRKAAAAASPTSAETAGSACSTHPSGDRSADSSCATNATVATGRRDCGRRRVEACETRSASTSGTTDTADALGRRAAIAAGSTVTGT
jgi:hypothetical protein